MGEKRHADQTSGVKMLFLSSEILQECKEIKIFLSTNQSVLFTLNLTKSRWTCKVMIARALLER